MATLSDSLVKEFVEVTDDSSGYQTTDGITVYGSVVRNGDKVYVKIDGSELLTPVSEAMDSKDKDRVMVLVKDHVATVVGNVTAPATNDTEEIKQINADIDQVNEDIDNTNEEVKKVDVKVDEANGRITAEVTRASGAEGELSSQIRQTADSITAEVTRASGAEGELSSQIRQTADSITAEVTRASGAEDYLNSRINQTADAITAEVTRASGAEGELGSRIQQTADAISAEVRRATETEGALSSQIRQTADSISSRVSYTDFNGNEIASRINQTATKISLKANQFEFISAKCKIIDGKLSVDSIAFYDDRNGSFHDTMEFDPDIGAMKISGSFCVDGDIYTYDTFGGSTSKNKLVKRKEVMNMIDEAHKYMKNLLDTHCANQVGTANWNEIGSNSWVVTSCGLNNSGGQVNIYGNHLKKSLSDRRLKEHIVELDDRYIALYSMLKPVAYTFHEDIPTVPGRHYGLIAQDVKDAVDVAGVHEDELRLVYCSLIDKEAREDKYIDDHTWNLDYEELHALHIKYSQYLEKRITEQDKLIEKLTKRVEQLEELINN